MEPPTPWLEASTSYRRCCPLHLELYDTHEDPDEIVNLAFHPETHKAQILQLNAKVNALVGAEIGVDDGSMYPGEPRNALSADATGIAGVGL